MHLQKTAIGQRIRALRKRLKQSQKQFARQLGVSDKTISGYELGDVLVPLDILVQICAIGNVTSDWLLFGFDSRPDELTANETDLIMNYRRADEEDQAAIRRFAKYAARE